MPQQNGPDSARTATLEPRDDLRLTRHHLRIGGVHIPYTATAGTMVLREESFGQGEGAEASEGHKPRAEVFVTSATMWLTRQAGPSRSASTGVPAPPRSGSTWGCWAPVG